MENKIELKAKRKRNWKKVALIFGAGLALVGTGIAIVVKAKNGEDMSDEIPYDYIYRELSDGTLAEITMCDGGIREIILQDQTVDSFADSLKELLDFTEIVDPAISEIHFTADICDFSFVGEGNIGRV